LYKYYNKIMKLHSGEYYDEITQIISLFGLSMMKFISLNVDLIILYCFNDNDYEYNLIDLFNHAILL
jgi:hypothetical protein